MKPSPRFTWALAAALTIAVGLWTTSSLGADQAGGSGAQASGKASDTAKTARGSADSDPNVKTPPAANDPAKDTPAPARKGGQKTRGMACYVNFDNYTPWFVEAFVDGTYRGTVAPWGDLDTVTGDGPTEIYARARFTDGSMKYWGPRSGMCVNDAFRWELRR
jgi:hypothetical protein